MSRFREVEALVKSILAEGTSLYLARYDAYTDKISREDIDELIGAGGSLAYLGNIVEPFMEALGDIEDFIEREKDE